MMPPRNLDLKHLKVYLDLRKLKLNLGNLKLIKKIIRNLSQKIIEKACQWPRKEEHIL